jgi:methylenetetrahydrofolate dehydrogenase (NADP+)/methenyltetrahydrofolate cyclohydrolase
VGKKNLITPDMVKNGVVLIDVGDAAPEVAKKCSLFTPTPGGLGPLVVAMVFKNLVELNK